MGEYIIHPYSAPAMARPAIPGIIPGVLYNMRLSAYLEGVLERRLSRGVHMGAKEFPECLF
jgi:hypothetical protein